MKNVRLLDFLDRVHRPSHESKREYQQILADARNIENPVEKARNLGSEAGRFIDVDKPLARQLNRQAWQALSSMIRIPLQHAIETRIQSSEAINCIVGAVNPDYIGRVLRAASLYSTTHVYDGQHDPRSKNYLVFATEVARRYIYGDITNNGGNEVLQRVLNGQPFTLDEVRGHMDFLLSYGNVLNSILMWAIDTNPSEQEKTIYIELAREINRALVNIYELSRPEPEPIFNFSQRRTLANQLNTLALLEYVEGLTDQASQTAQQSRELLLDTTQIIEFDRDLRSDPSSLPRLGTSQNQAEAIQIGQFWVERNQPQEASLAEAGLEKLYEASFILSRAQGESSAAQNISNLAGEREDIRNAQRRCDEFDHGQRRHRSASSPKVMKLKRKMRRWGQEERAATLRSQACQQVAAAEHRLPIKIDTTDPQVYEQRLIAHGLRLSLSLDSSATDVVVRERFQQAYALSDSSQAYTDVIGLLLTEVPDQQKKRMAQYLAGVLTDRIKWRKTQAERIKKRAQAGKYQEIGLAVLDDLDKKALARLEQDYWKYRYRGLVSVPEARKQHKRLELIYYYYEHHTDVDKVTQARVALARRLDQYEFKGSLKQKLQLCVLYGVKAIVIRLWPDKAQALRDGQFSLTLKLDLLRQVVDQALLPALAFDPKTVLRAQDFVLLDSIRSLLFDYELRLQSLRSCRTLTRKRKKEQILELQRTVEETTDAYIGQLKKHSYLEQVWYRVQDESLDGWNRVLEATLPDIPINTMIFGFSTSYRYPTTPSRLDCVSHYAAAALALDRSIIGDQGTTLPRSGELQVNIMLGEATGKTSSNREVTISRSQAADDQGNISLEKVRALLAEGQEPNSWPSVIIDADVEVVNEQGDSVQRVNITPTIEDIVEIHERTHGNEHGSKMPSHDDCMVAYAAAMLDGVHTFRDQRVTLDGQDASVSMALGVDHERGLVVLYEPQITLVIQESPTETRAITIRRSEVVDDQDPRKISLEKVRAKFAQRDQQTAWLMDITDIDIDVDATLQQLGTREQLTAEAVVLRYKSDQMELAYEDAQATQVKKTQKQRAVLALHDHYAQEVAQGRTQKNTFGNWLQAQRIKRPFTNWAPDTGREWLLDYIADIEVDITTTSDQTDPQIGIRYTDPFEQEQLEQSEMLLREMQRKKQAVVNLAGIDPTTDIRARRFWSGLVRESDRVKSSHLLFSSYEESPTATKEHDIPGGSAAYCIAHVAFSDDQQIHVNTSHKHNFADGKPVQQLHHLFQTYFGCRLEAMGYHLDPLVPVESPRIEQSFAMQFERRALPLWGDYCYKTALRDYRTIYPFWLLFPRINPRVNMAVDIAKQKRTYVGNAITFGIVEAPPVLPIETTMARTVGAIQNARDGIRGAEPIPAIYIGLISAPDTETRLRLALIGKPLQALIARITGAEGIVASFLPDKQFDIPAGFAPARRHNASLSIAIAGELETLPLLGFQSDNPDHERVIQNFENVMRRTMIFETALARLAKNLN